MAVSVKDVQRLVSVLICLLASGPGRERSRTLTALCYTKQALLTPSSTCSLLSCVETKRDPEFRYTPGVSQDIESTSQGTEQLTGHTLTLMTSHVFSCFNTYTVCKQIPSYRKHYKNLYFPKLYVHHVNKCI